MQLLTCAVLVILAQSAALLAPSWGFSRKLIASVGVSAAMGFAGVFPAPAFATIDCNKDCVFNCNKVAPGSTEYCKMSCR
jgi:hypothetical protein